MLLHNGEEARTEHAGWSVDLAFGDGIHACLGRMQGLAAPMSQPMI